MNRNITSRLSSEAHLLPFKQLCACRATALKTTLKTKDKKLPTLRMKQRKLRGGFQKFIIKCLKRIVDWLYRACKCSKYDEGCKLMGMGAVCFGETRSSVALHGGRSVAE